jgi:hypothetical protein
LPAALGSNAAHRHFVATFATRFTQHVGQAGTSLQKQLESDPNFPQSWNITLELHGMGTIF